MNADTHAGLESDDQRKNKRRRGPLAPAAAAAAAVAANPATGRALLWLLVLPFGRSRAVARAVAGNPASGGRLLSSVARRSLRRGYWNVALVALEHPACPARSYRRLWRGSWSASGGWSFFPAIDAAVAVNSRASPFLWDRLEHVSPAWLRLHMAANPAAPARVINRLLGDVDPYVRRVAAAHPAASPERLRQLCADFAQPAWTLRAAATNPTCPEDLSDQLLTWLALGGAGASDPLFDPVTCSGHPGPTEQHPATWYANAARQAGAATHPLWRVRAAIPSALGRIPISTLTLLARDSRPEVRRQAARFSALPYSVLEELHADTDPSVVRLAEAALKNKAKERLPWLRSMRRLRWLPLTIVIIVTAISGLLNAHTPPSSSGLPPADISGSLPFADTITAPPGTVTVTRPVAGGGVVEAGTVAGAPQLPFVWVTAGSVPLTVTVPDAVSFGASDTAVSGPVQVGAGQHRLVVLPYDPTSIDVTVTAPKEPPAVLHIAFDSRQG